MFGAMMDDFLPSRPRRKKVDYEALQSPFARIPGLDLATVRDLLDSGYRQVDDLRGRSPEALLEEILDRREQTPRDRLYMLRLAVYYAEAEQPDPARLSAWYWKD